MGALAVLALGMAWSMPPWRMSCGFELGMFICQVQEMT